MLDLLTLRLLLVDANVQRPHLPLRILLDGAIIDDELGVSLQINSRYDDWVFHSDIEPASLDDDILMLDFHVRLVRVREELANECDINELLRSRCGQCKQMLEIIAVDNCDCEPIGDRLTWVQPLDASLRCDMGRQVPYSDQAQKGCYGYQRCCGWELEDVACRNADLHQAAGPR